MISSSEFSAGQWVQVRSKEEILASLDKQGTLDGLPFMPEMLEFCGQTFKVFKRAHKTCDPPNGMSGRRMHRTVHLEDVRCNGGAHAGCEAACLMFWRDSWLKPVADGETASLATATREGSASSPATATCTEADVHAATMHPPEEGAPIRYVCQSTALPAATLPLRWWDMRQYVEDYSSGNVELGRILKSFIAFVWNEVASAGLGLGSALRWTYDRIQRARRGAPYPWRNGKVKPGTRTPTRKLDLQPGELVRVRSYEEILETIDESFNNRGMAFDAEMVPYCGGTYKVLRRVNTLIDEKSGKVLRLKNECIQLEGVVCTACYAKYRRFCPRAIFPYWREIWLERVGQPQTADACPND